MRMQEAGCGGKGFNLDLASPILVGCGGGVEVGTSIPCLLDTLCYGGYFDREALTSRY